jgi:hypothetical protein
MPPAGRDHGLLNRSKRKIIIHRPSLSEDGADLTKGAPFSFGG